MNCRILGKKKKISQTVKVLVGVKFQFLSQVTIPIIKQLSGQNLEKKTTVLERNPQQLFQNINLEKHVDQIPHPKQVQQVGNSAFYKVLYLENHSIIARKEVTK